MGAFWSSVAQAVKSAFARGIDDKPPPQQQTRMKEAAGAQGEDDGGWRSVSGRGLSEYNERDLSPMAQHRMQLLAEYLWQSNLMANRLIELPLAYLLAEGVKLQCKNPEHQKLLDAFWLDPINNWPLKLSSRVRALALLGEQCYVVNVREGDGFVRLGYLDPRQIATIVCDPDNPEQPIGVVTKSDTRGRQYKYKTLLIGDDADLFTPNTVRIRETFSDGDVLLYQLNKLPNGSRGRSDLLAQMDWLDAYDGFLLDELDRIGYLRSFVWDVTMAGADQEAVEKYEKNFKPPAPNSTFVHNDNITLEAKTPPLQAADTSESARLIRNHVLGGSTMPEHWFGGGGDVNRNAASEMGEPTFKAYNMRQSFLKLMLEEMGRVVLWMSAKTQATPPNWMEDDWKVTAVFPELANKDIAKFAAALAQVVNAVVVLIDSGLMTRQTAMEVVADIAGRFGQEIDVEAELERASAELATKKQAAMAADVFTAPTAPEQAQAIP